MAIAVYHRVMRREGFEVTAKTLVEMTRDAQYKYPNEPRTLYLDIDDHRNESGGFDADMFELQKEFILGFLLPFYTEAHIPLVSVKNPNEQDNDVPDRFIIANLDKKEDTGLTSLYLENYSNTEFVSEEPVYHYLERVSFFLDNVRSTHPMHMAKKGATGNFEWRLFWSGYAVDLIMELFNSFVLGNLISVTAMTRSLIESCAYMMIFDQTKGSDLVIRWLMCSSYRSANKMDTIEKRNILTSLRECCEDFGMQYDEIIACFSKGNENAWLCGLINKKRISFRDVCDYLGDGNLYEDFRYVCSFVHGQDLATKMSPFTFYVSIYSKLYIMMDYIFRVLILLFPEDTDLKEDVDALRDGLIELSEYYLE